MSISDKIRHEQSILIQRDVLLYGVYVPLYCIRNYMAYNYNWNTPRISSLRYCKRVIDVYEIAVADKDGLRDKINFIKHFRNRLIIEESNTNTIPK